VPQVIQGQVSIALKAGRSDSPIANVQSEDALRSLNCPQYIAIVRPGAAQKRNFDSFSDRYYGGLHKRDPLS